MDKADDKPCKTMTGMEENKTISRTMLKKVHVKKLQHIF